MKAETSRQMYLVLGGVVLLLFLVFFALRLESSSPAFSEFEAETVAALPTSEQVYLQALLGNLQSGGVPKDGIPAIDVPRYESVEDANEWLLPEDVVFGVVYGDEVFAIPQRIMTFHEILNESIGGEALSVTYCPLTGTAIGYVSPSPHAGDPSLGVSGKLTNSNLVMYDRATDSYWPQILGAAITGPEVSNRLEEFPVVWTTWSQWRSAYPETRVLSRETGFLRDYSVKGDPYGSYIEQEGYYVNERLAFPVVHEDPRLGNKGVVVGVRDAQRNAVAILKSDLREKGELLATLGDREVRVTYLPELDAHTAVWTDTNVWVNSIDAMWFAWAAYYPDTQLIQ